MNKRKDKYIRKQNRYEALELSENKKNESRASHYINVSYQIRKIFSYCDADILRIEQSLTIYNNIIDSIKKNGNKLVKKEVEQIVRTKTGIDDYCVKQMSTEVLKIDKFDLKKVELDFKFIECSLCFELAKFLCVQACNHTFCLLCLHRLLNMNKKNQGTEGDTNVDTEGDADPGISFEEFDKDETDPFVSSGYRNHQFSSYHSSHHYRHRNDKYHYDSRFDQRRFQDKRIKTLKNKYTMTDTFGICYIDIITPHKEPDRKKHHEEDYGDFPKKREYTKEKEIIAEEKKEESQQESGMKVPCPFCKEENQFLLIGLNDFYTYFTYENLLNTLLRIENDKQVIVDTPEFVQLYDSYLKKKVKYEREQKVQQENQLAKIEKSQLDQRKDLYYHRNRGDYHNSNRGMEYHYKREEYLHSYQKESMKSKVIAEQGEESDFEKDMDMVEKLENGKYDSEGETIKKELKKQLFYNYFDGMVVLKHILKNEEEYGNKLRKGEENKNNMYLSVYYEKYIKWKKKRIKNIPTCIKTNKKYALFCKVFLEVEKKIFYEHFFIFSIYMILKNYTCLLNCTSEWTAIRDDKIETFIFKNKNRVDPFFERIYIKKERDLLRKKVDSIYDKFNSHMKMGSYISEDEYDSSDEYFKVVDIFYKRCFTKLNSIGFLEYLGNHCYSKLVALNDHLTKHQKVYCAVCLGNQDNMFLFEHNIYNQNLLKNHVQYGEQINIGSCKSWLRHILCHFCSLYYYDFEQYKVHINKVHFFCKFCFNTNPKKSLSNKNNEGMEEEIYYDDLHLHVYQDYSNLLKHYKNFHYPCLFEECIFIVFESEVELSLHLAEKHKKDPLKKSKITVPIGGSSYNAQRQQRERLDRRTDDRRRVIEDQKTPDIKESDEKEKEGNVFDVKKNKCIYNLNNFEQTWYFDYFIECKIVSFLNFFEGKKNINFLQLMKNDLYIIVSTIDDLTQKKKDLYFSQDEIFDLNRSVLSVDFHLNKKNNFFLFQMFYDDIKEKVESLLYKMEDSGKAYLYLFFKIMIHRAFIMYYAYFYMYITKKGKTGGQSNKKESNSFGGLENGGGIRIKDELLYSGYSEEEQKLKKRLDANTNVDLNKLSRYGFLFLISLFIKTDKCPFEKIASFLKNISAFCQEMSNTLQMKKSSEDKNNIVISLKMKQEGSLRKESLEELESVDQLISAHLKGEKTNTSIINDIYDRKLEISKKVTLDLLFYITPDLNLLSFFYLFLNNYFIVFHKERNLDILSKVPIEYKNRIMKQISCNSDLSSLTAISKDLGKLVNAQTLEECLSTCAEYHRIRKDVQNILKNEILENSKKKNGANEFSGINKMSVYDISLTLRTRFPNIIKISKVNELYIIYFYIHSILHNSPSLQDPQSDFPHLPTNNSPTTNPSDYIQRVQNPMHPVSNMKATMNSGPKRGPPSYNNDFPPLPKTERGEEDSDNFIVAIKKDPDIPFTVKVKSPNKTKTTGVTKNISKKEKKGKVEEGTTKNHVNKMPNVGKKVEANHLKEIKKTNHIKEQNKKEKSIPKEIKNEKKKSVQTSNSINNKTASAKVQSTLKTSKSNDTTKNKKNESTNMNTNVKKEKLSYVDTNEFPSIPIVPEEVNKKSKKKKKKNTLINEFDKSDFPALPIVKPLQTIEKKNPKKDQSEDPLKETLSSYLNLCKSNIKLVEKKKKHVEKKRCGACTYDNPHDRIHCEMCNSTLK